MMIMMMITALYTTQLHVIFYSSQSYDRGSTVFFLRYRLGECYAYLLMCECEQYNPKCYGRDGGFLN